MSKSRAKRIRATLAAIWAAEVRAVEARVETTADRAGGALVVGPSNQLPCKEMYA